MQSHDHAAVRHAMCDGQPWHPQGGSWIGHLLPGVVLLIWGLHWGISACLVHLTSSKYTAAAFRGVITPWGRPLGPQQAESWFKVLLPVLAMYLEWTLSGTQQLVCPPGSARAGAADVQHINSFSHMTNYPTVILSGVVDLLTYTPALAMRVELPQSAPHAFLSFSFGSNAFLMLAHSKHAPLDAAVHLYMGVAMAVVAALVAAEGVWRHSYMLSWVKSTALLVEGAWFLAVTHIMFEPDPFWSTTLPEGLHGEVEGTPLMVLPLLMAWIVLGVIVFQLLLHVVLACVAHHFSNSGKASDTRPLTLVARKQTRDEGLQLLPRAELAQSC